jgi:DNA polymerase-3 subunit epsilon
MMLAFDSETDGLTLTREKPSHPRQPHLVQLGCLLFDKDGLERGTISLIIKPDGWIIPPGAIEAHGITNEMAHDLGVPLIVALAIFNHLVKISSTHVAHNVDFDIKVLMAAFHRANRPFPAMNPRCTKDLADPIMKMPPTEKMVAAGFGWKTKPPKLVECVKFFFNEDLPGAHDALVDARACARVFFEIERRQRLEIISEVNPVVGPAYLSINQVAAATASASAHGSL